MKNSIEQLSERRFKMRKSKTLTIMASVIIMSALMFAGCRDRMRSSVHHDAVMHITKTLSLDESQQSKLKEVVQQSGIKAGNSVQVKVL
jgi:hypothetical protein